jgi:hypothetical protein
MNAVSTNLTTNANAHPVTNPGACSRISTKAVARPGVISSSSSETLAIQPPNEARLPTRQPKDETVISKEQTRSLRCPPMPLTTCSRLKSLLASPVQDRPACRSNGNPKPSPSTVMVRLVERPEETAVITEGQTSIVPRSPMRQKPLPARQMQASPAHLPSNKPRLPVKEVARTCSTQPTGTTAISGKRINETEGLPLARLAHSSSKPLPVTSTQAMPRPSKEEPRPPPPLEKPIPPKRPKTRIADNASRANELPRLQIAEVRSPQQTPRKNPPTGTLLPTECPSDTMVLALPQAQASNLPNEVGEEQHTADVVNKIIKTKTTQLTPPSQLSASPMQTSYPHVPNEPTWALEAERHIHNVAMNGKEETSVEQHSQEGSVGYAPIPLPTHQAQDPPALPKQAMPIRKPPDEVLLTVKTTPE